MTFEQALAKLKEERWLRTDMLEPLQLSFEFFLQFGQLSPSGEQKVLDQLIEFLEGKRV